MKKANIINGIITVLSISACIMLSSCTDSPYEGKAMTVVCVPVFGQSLALGEEAVRITDFDTLRTRYGHRIVTERMDENFGYFSDTELKQTIKRLIKDNKRSFELSVYGMAEEFLSRTDYDSVIICIFPGGQGETSITELMPGSAAYDKFIGEIRDAYKRATEQGWTFSLPAYCWMQGENDIAWLTSDDYRKDMETWHAQFGKDVMRLTGQQQPPVCISYQANCLTRAERPFTDTTYDRPETYVPNAQYQLIKERHDFMVSGPTYPYDAVGERIHIDATGQKLIGHLAGLTLWRLLRGENSDGLMPHDYIITDSVHITVTFNVPQPPLVWDTVKVTKPDNYGFNVISPKGKDIIKNVSLSNDTVFIECTENVKDAKLRYAVNGTPGKSGRKRGSRGCLRDSQGDIYKCEIGNEIYRLDNWCLQFEQILEY